MNARERLLGLLVLCIIALAYLSVGVVCAMTLFVLSGRGSVSQFVWLTFLSPPFFFTWVLLADYSNLLEYKSHSMWPRHSFRWKEFLKRAQGPGFFPFEHDVTWVWTLICVAPALFNLSSILLQFLGFALIAQVLHDERYMSPLYGVVSIIVLFFLQLMLDERNRNRQEEVRKV